MHKFLTHVGLAAAAFIAVYGLTHPTTVTTSARASTPQVAVAATPAPALTAGAPVATNDLKAAAGQQYLAAVTAYNTALVQCRGKLQALLNTAVANAVPPIQSLLAAMQVEEAAVLAIRFPATAQADAATELRTIGSDIAAAQAFIKSPTSANWNSLNDTIPHATAASNALRTDLALPPVPTL